MKKLDMNVDDLFFKDFLSSRYSISARINVEDLWNYSKKENLSFFILSLGCLNNGLNSVPEMRRRIINNEVVEFENLDAVCPIMSKDEKNYGELRFDYLENIDSVLEWHDYVSTNINQFLEGKKESFSIDLLKRDQVPIANFSCIPWLDFDSITTCIANSQQIQPLVTWGKVNKNYEMTVSITVNHMFVDGKCLSNFYKYSQDNFNQISSYL